MKKEATAGVSGRTVDWKRKCYKIRRKGKLRVGDGMGSGPQKTCTSNSGDFLLNAYDVLSKFLIRNHMILFFVFI